MGKNFAGIIYKEIMRITIKSSGQCTLPILVDHKIELCEACALGQCKGFKRRINRRG